MAHEEQLAQGGISRRKLIATGATLAAAGVAAGAVGTVAVSAVQDHVAIAAAPAEPIMAHVVDGGGRIDVFVGEKKFSFTDRTIAAELVKQAANAS